MQMDYWLSDEWEEEARERLFWNAEKLDFDPVENVGGTYVPAFTELENRKLLSARSKANRKRLEILPLLLLAVLLVIMLTLFQILQF